MSDKNGNNTNEKIKPVINPDILSAVPPPHVKHGETTAAIMSRVLIALFPSLIWAVVVFGYRAVTLTLISVITCILCEFLWQTIWRKPVRTGDLSAVVTGVLIAFALPVNAPLWAPVTGGAFAIIAAKQLFGGIGKNIVNPAVAAHIFLSLAFDFMSVFQDIGAPHLSPFEITPAEPAVTAGTPPLFFLNDGMTPPSVSMLDMFLGQHPGLLGEISALLLLAGGIYLILRKVITWHIPVSCIGTVTLLAFLGPRGIDHIEFTVTYALAGGLMLGAFFMATDYATSPMMLSGQLIFGAGCGLITVFIRYFGVYPEGVSFSIMIMNLFVWYIDKLTKPVKFGGAANVRKQ